MRVVCSLLNPVVDPPTDTEVYVAGFRPSLTQNGDICRINLFFPDDNYSFAAFHCTNGSLHKARGCKVEWFSEKVEATRIMSLNRPSRLF